MSPPDPAGVSPWAALIELVGALWIVGYAGAALVSLLRGRGVVASRLLLAEGAVLGLSFKTAGALLKTVELHSWDQIGRFGAVLAVRLLLKRLFAWERARLTGPR